MEMVMGNGDEASKDALAELDQHVFENQNYDGSSKSGSESPVMAAERARSGGFNSNLQFTFAQPASTSEEEKEVDVASPEKGNNLKQQKDGGRIQQS
eukprot:CAMPEP_0170486656 /NCGR_PEP_ID=MMETSP0208-20121228/5604_1 /TAXON_ID=197538 /ORGANISM="Strombidium inclinatum, Strain S3" /LENGTH=96 /DNA_ID=CAMNT_0010760659 /DNA_START=191 /DNA_END=481 /DNA_ORIENTATION=+